MNSSTKKFLNSKSKSSLRRRCLNSRVQYIRSSPDESDESINSSHSSPVESNESTEPSHLSPDESNESTNLSH